MNFSEDFVLIQGILSNAQKNIGDFLSIKHRGGNEQKIKTIVEDLRRVFIEKKYYRKGKINSKHEQNLREICLFLIINTEFNNKNIFADDNKYVHLIDVVPQLSKCLLTNIIWGLELWRFYSEAVYSLPVEISVELLENVNKCIKRSEPYLVLEQVALVALAIYVKLYGIRTECVDETKVNICISRLLEKFTEILQNYITPETEKMKSWPKTEMYQYMAVAIYKILHLLRCAFDIFLEKNPVGDLDEIYQVKTTGSAYSPERLDRSAQALKKCNICLISVCEANLQAVTVDVFCSWAEYKHNNALIQEKIGSLSYEVRQHLNSFEGCGMLPQMLDAIMVKPKTVDEKISDANEAEIIKNVIIRDENQPKWIDALIKFGVVSSSEMFTVFKTIVTDLQENHYIILLNYNFSVKNPELTKIILKYIVNLELKTLINIITQYFITSGINDVFETENFNSQLGDVLNKMISTSEEVPKDVLTLVLQNPMVFLHQLMIESIKNPEQLSNILKIIDVIEPICGIEKNGGPFLTEIILKFLKEYNLERQYCKLFSEFLNKIPLKYLMSKNILDELSALMEYFMEINVSEKSIIMLELMEDLPDSVKMSCNNKELISKLTDVLSKTRWNFLTYSDEKLQINTVTIKLIVNYKNFIPKETLNETFEKLQGNSMNAYYLTDQSEPFTKFCNLHYQKPIQHTGLVYHLLMSLPSCNPQEWGYITEHLTNENKTLDVFNMYMDVMLILSEITNKSKNLLTSLSYCFQQYCVQIKNLMYPSLKENVDDYKIFVKRILTLIKHLPKELHATNELSLINLFDFEVIKTMLDDNDFVYILYSISHLEICKVIMCKLH